MEFEGYSDRQKEILLDLLLFGMYLDGNLTAIEDRRIGELLDTMEFASPDARNRFLDSAYTRTRQRSSSPEAVRSFVTGVAKEIDSPELRRRSFNLLSSMVASDNNLIDKERTLLQVVREEFKLRTGA